MTQFYTTDPSLKQRLSCDLELILNPHGIVSDHQWYLSDSANRLELNGSLNGQHFCHRFDLLSAAMSFRRQYGGGRQEPLAKAIGLKHNAMPTVVDATAGMGREAFLLASMGCKVIAIERQPIIFVLLQDAFVQVYQAQNSPIQPENLVAINANSIEWLQTTEIIPDVVYLDPMFPSRDKSAAVKKEMRIFKAISGGDVDADQLLQTARTVATKRVVVKRPNSAPFLNNLKPAFQIVSKKHRFDVYLPS